MASNFTVKIDDKALDEFYKKTTVPGLIKFCKEVHDNVDKYIPEDTESLKKQKYLVRERGMKELDVRIDLRPDDVIIIGIGSKTGDKKINKVAVYQHEENLYHYGSPKGRSMREGVENADIPGQPWAVAGVSRTNNVLKRQAVMYQRGYRQKKQAGLLTQYPAKFLEKAVMDALKNWKKHFEQK